MDDVVSREDGDYFLGRYEIPLDLKKRLDKIAKSRNLGSFTDLIDFGVALALCYEDCDPTDTLTIVRRDANNKPLQLWSL